ncbi:uncharacterized protein LOC111482896 [Cucurbita maxima]|uniref:Uncharacterized protein LOC111482896 n=1 Tax=Cucurbita maxima TaxID=3661 RepID=A0A6J1JBA0_CUCMA|nr:uncharacterized protein LOC111482896 [Cucurbita maxima]XP_022984694.1 uncharacterized protein LOC111482896 [Cucurbita maxima]
MEDLNRNVSQAPPSLQTRSSPDGPVAILWDIENCPVPSDVRPEDVAGNIRMALRVHPVIKGAVMMFSAYGDFNAFPRRLREGCQRTGVKLIDVPNGRKDAADKAILVDMFLFALDNPPPSSIMLISGDVDFAPALHILGQRGYNVILVIPSGVGVSSALCNAGKYVWDWPTVARGEGFALSPKMLTSRGGVAEISGYLKGCHINDDPDGSQNEEEAIVYGGVSHGYYNLRDFSVVTQSLSEYNGNSTVPCAPPSLRSQSLPCGLSDVPTGPVSCGDQNESAWWPQTGDLNVLKGQLVKLLELSGGSLPITKVRAEYQRVFGRPLYTSEPGVKLVNLFKKMGDALIVEGKGNKKSVYIRNSRSCPSAPPLILSRKENKKGKGTSEETIDIAPGMGSSDEYSEEERVVHEEHDEKEGVAKNNNECGLEQFKHQLQEILVSYSCRIFLGCFEAIYLQRYKKALDFQSLGVRGLEELLDKVGDVVVLHEDPGSKRKFLAALGG